MKPSSAWLPAMLAACLSLWPAGAPALAPWGPFIPPDYPWLLWSGRVDFHGRVARFDWSQVGLRCEFEGSACALYLDPGNNDFNAFVDGRLKAILGPPPQTDSLQDTSYWIQPQKNEVRVWVLQGLGPGRHRLELNKRSGANFGVAKFYGLRLDSGAMLEKPSPAPARKLEFIGDSYTNAYGCEAGGKKCSERRVFENGWKSYAALTARELDAETQVLALSGYGVVRNYGDASPVSKRPLPLYYGRVVSGQDQGLWDRSKFKPDAIVIQLGSNDFSTRPYPSQEVFVKGYLDLLGQALQGREGTPVFIVNVHGSRLQDASVGQVVEAAKARGVDAQLVEFDEAHDDEMGCDWHPQAVVHARWAKILCLAMKDHLHW